MSCSRPAALRIEELESGSALEKLCEEWTSLWESCPAATPFQSPEWLLAWLRHLGTGVDLWTVLIRRDGRLVGLAPFYVYRFPDTGIRQLTLLGNGVTDQLDVLAEPGMGAEVGRAVMEHISEQRTRWDTADLRDLPCGSPLLSAPRPVGISDSIERTDACPVLTLPDKASELAHAIKAPRLLRNLRYARRRAEKCGPVQIEEASRSTVDEILSELFQLHQARWRERGEAGLLSDAAVQAMVHDAASGFLARNWLRLYRLLIGGRSVAVQLGWTARARAYYYVSGWDPEFAAISPGGLLVEHAVKAAVRESAREFDFLRGCESYKYDRGASDCFQHRRRFDTFASICPDHD